MPLIPSKPSPEIVSALQKGLSDLGLPIPDAANIQGNHVFTLRVDTLATGASTADARASGWQFRITEGKNTLFADVSEAQPPGPSLTRVAESKVVHHVLRDMDHLGNSPDTANAAYELRVLRINGLRTEAFWLVSATGAGDLIVPYLTLSKNLERMHFYPAAEFFAIAAKMAQSELKPPDSQQQ